MQIYDLSMPLSEVMPVYKNREEKRPKLEMCSAKGKLFESKLTLPLHTGTHLDSPRHMFPHGPGIAAYPLSQMVTPCQVLDLTFVEAAIGREHLEKYEIKEKSILLKTRNSQIQSFDPDFVYLNQAGAAFLVERKVTIVGIDALGIERNQENHQTHHTLFSHGIWILEGLRLDKVPAGRYLLVITPLLIEDAEASPVRALLLKTERT